ncbi:peptidase inhibitor family I36 protein [Micromonospora sp. NPDC049282]|uniref:peptidase inhibitor family I36 protein n=1 Tax=Micromonospora sp. NPDC049282 TaxID=3364269 RepID=UPI00371314A9
MAALTAVTASPAAAAPPRAAAESYPCYANLLCLYDGINFTGRVAYFEVGFANDCRDIPVPSNFANKARSIINNRPSGTVSTFWDNANATGLLGYQHAYGYRANLAYDSAAIGGNWDRRIEAVRVC